MRACGARSAAARERGLWNFVPPDGGESYAILSERVAPFLSASGQVVSGNKNASTYLIGTTTAYFLLTLTPGPLPDGCTPPSATCPSSARTGIRRPAGSPRTIRFLTRQSF